MTEKCSDLHRRGELEQFVTTKTGKPRQRNRYPAVCAFCGERLAPGDGFIVSVKSGRAEYECAIFPRST